MEIFQRRIQRAAMGIAGQIVVSDFRQSGRTLSAERSGGIQSPNQTGQQIIDEIITFGYLMDATAGLLVTAAPIHNTRMIPQTFYLILTICQGIFLPRRIVLRQVRTGKHKVLENHNAHFVAVLIKRVVFVKAAAPHTEHIHIAILCKLQKGLIPLFCNASHKTVGRNPVSTLCHHLDAVDIEFKSDQSVIFGLLCKLHFPESTFARFRRNYLAIAVQHHLIAIHRLLAVAIGPPKLWLVHKEIHKTLFAEQLYCLCCIYAASRRRFHGKFQFVVLLRHTGIGNRYAIVIHSRFNIVIYFGNKGDCAVVVRPISHIFNTSGADTFYRNLTADAIAGNLRYPVPAKAALHSSQENPGGIKYTKIACAVNLIHYIQSGMEFNLQDILIFS